MARCQPAWLLIGDIHNPTIDLRQSEERCAENGIDSAMVKNLFLR